MDRDCLVRELRDAENYCKVKIKAEICKFERLGSSQREDAEKEVDNRVEEYASVCEKILDDLFEIQIGSPEKKLCTALGYKSVDDLQNNLNFGSKCAISIAKIAEIGEYDVADLVENPNMLADNLILMQKLKDLSSSGDVLDDLISLKQSATRDKTTISMLEKRLDELNRKLQEATMSESKQSNRKHGQITDLSSSELSKEEDNSEHEFQGSLRSSQRSKKKIRPTSGWKQAHSSENLICGGINNEPDTKDMFRQFISAQLEMQKVSLLPKLAKFSGEKSDERSFKEFIRSFEARYSPQTFDEETRCVMLGESLSGVAKTHLECIPKSERNCFKSLVKTLSERLGCESKVTQYAALTALDKLSYNGRTVYDLNKMLAELDQLALRAFPNDTKTQMIRKAHILVRMFNHRRDLVLQLAQIVEESDDVDAYENAKKLLLRRERFYERNNGDQAEAKQKFSEPQREFLPRRPFSGRLEAKHSPVYRRVRLNEEPKTAVRNILKDDDKKMRIGKNDSCFRCGKTGHFAKNCTVNRTVERSAAETSPIEQSNGAFQTLHTKIVRSCNVISKVSRAPRYGEQTKMKVQLLDSTHECLVDTGSQISIVSADIIRRAHEKGVDIIKELKELEADPKQIVQTVEGNALNFLGEGELKVTLPDNGRASIIPFKISAVLKDFVLLGTNALQSLGIKLVIEQKLGSSSSTPLQCDMGTSNVNVVALASIIKRKVVKPGCEGTVTVTGPNSEQCAFFSNNEEVGIFGVECEGGLSDIPVINEGMHPMAFAKGDCLGYWEAPKTARCLTVAEMQLLDYGGTNSSISQEQKILELKRLLSKSGEEFSAIQKLIVEYQDVFALEESELTQTDIVSCGIDTGNYAPIRQRARRVPYGARQKLKEILTGLLEKNVIENSSSEWASPIVLVEKKDGTLRLCVDFRELNKIIKQDAYPLPNIDVALQSLAGKSYFSTLDLQSGFWQCPLRDDAKEKTAFTTPEGLFQFRVLPFGLATSPAIFQRMIDSALHDVEELGTEVFLYVDDILVATSTRERHMVVLDKVLSALRKANLKIKAQKCKILEEKVPYLGHVVDKEGVHMDPDKVEAINNYPSPRNLAELRTFLGMSSYYRKFVYKFATITRPLHDLTAKDCKWEWTKECESAFVELKSRMVNAPVLAQPDMEAAKSGDKPFIIFTDASRIGVGAVLCQKGNDDLLHPLYFVSKSLNKAQRNYGITDLEALAVIFATEKFHYFIFGMNVVVRTDHQALLALFKKTDVSPRVMRWAMQLMSYPGLKLEYVKGSANVVADALSRGAATASDSSDGVKEWEALVVAHNELVTDKVNLAEEEDTAWLKMLENDVEFAAIIKDIRTGNWDRSVKLKRMKSRVYISNFRIENGFLCFVDVNGSRTKVVPESCRMRLLNSVHSGVFAGHFGPVKMAKLLTKQFFWNGIYQDIRDFYEKCVKCFVNNNHPAIPPLQPILTTAPFELVAMDILDLGPTRNGNRYVLTVIDHFSKFVNAYPIPDKTAETVARAFVNNWICLGCRWPKSFLSDQGGEFVNSIADEIVKLTGCKWQTTKGHNPRENGLVERVQGTIIRSLKKLVNSPAEWDDVLPFVIYAINTTPHESTGESPYFLLHGMDPSVGMDVLPEQQLSHRIVDLSEYKTGLYEAVRTAREVAHERNMKAAEAMKVAYDKEKVNERKKIAAAGDRVFMFMPTERSKSRNPKLVTEYKGPYRVLESSETSALITLIGSNEEPLRVQHDFLLIAPPGWDDSARIETRTKRGSTHRKLKGITVCGLITVDFRLSESCFREDFWCTTEECSLSGATFAKVMEQQGYGILPVLASKKIKSMKQLAFFCSVLTNDAMRMPEKVVASQAREEEYMVTGLGVALAWHVAAARCVHIAREDTEFRYFDKTMRNRIDGIFRKDVLQPDRGFLNLSRIETEAAFGMVDRFQSRFEDMVESTILECGDLLLIPKEFRGISSDCFKFVTLWGLCCIGSFRRGQVFVRSYDGLAFLWAALQHLKAKQFSRIVVIGPLRPEGNEECNVGALVSKAKDMGAKEIRFIGTEHCSDCFYYNLAPPITKNYPQLLGKMKKLAEEAAMCSECVGGVTVLTWFPEVHSILARSPFGCLGCPCLDDGEDALTEERSRYLCSFSNFSKLRGFRRFFRLLKGEKFCETMGLGSFFVGERAKKRTWNNGQGQAGGSGPGPWKRLVQ